MSEFIRSLPKHYLEKKLYDINTFYNLGEIFIDENGCHLWRKARNTRGYGMVKLSCNGESRTVSAYSLIFYLRKGILPDGNQDLSHLCHRPQCVNIKHLNIEPHQINCQRSQCRQNKHCSLHESYPTCMFF